ESQFLRNIPSMLVCYEGTGIPICFEMLDKKGISNQSERIDLLSQFIEWFGAKRIGLLLADREFIGEDWLNYLSKEGIDFCIRVKNNTLIEINEVTHSAQDLLKRYAKKTFEGVGVMKQSVHVSLKRLPLLKGKKEDHLVLITNVNVDKALDLYRKRWTIEVFFQSLKGRGFDLEQSHLQDAQRMKKLFALSCVAFVICLMVGKIQHENVKEIPTYNHLYKQNSFFRVGKDFLEKAIRLFHLQPQLIELVFRPIRKKLTNIQYAFNLHKSFVT
ncbi:MAG: transposase, partial [Bacteroidota bacterium]